MTEFKANSSKEPIPRHRPRWRRRCYVLTTFGAVACIHLNWSIARAHGVIADIKQGSIVVAAESCLINDGADKGSQVELGTIAVCGKVEDDKVWISGPFSGWVAAGTVMSLMSAEKAWANRINDNDSDWNAIATLAYIQFLSNKIVAATETLRYLNNASEKTPYTRVIQAVVDARGPKKRRREIDSLCKEEVLTPYLATILVTDLLENDDLERARKVVDSFNWDEDLVGVGFLTCAANVAYMEGDLSRSRQMLDKALKRDPRYNEARRLRAWILARQGHLAEADRDLQECIRLWPEDSVAHRQLGFRLIESEDGNIAEGLHELRIALDLKPDDASVQFMIGRRLLVQAMKDVRLKSNPLTLKECASAFEQACKLTDYDRIDYVNALCLTYVELGMHKEAAQVVQKLERRYPPNDPRLIELDEIGHYIATKKIIDLTQEHNKSK